MSSLLTHRRPRLFWVLTALVVLAVAWATAQAAPGLRPAARRHSARLAAALTRPAAPARQHERVGAQTPGVAARVSARAGRVAPQAASDSLPFILHSFDGTTNGGSNPDAGPLLYVPGLNTVFGTTTGSSGTAQSTTGTVFSFGPGGAAPFQTLATSVGLLNNGLAFGTDSGGAASLFGTNGNGTTPYGEVFGLRLSDNAVSTVRVLDDQQPQFPVAPQAGLVAAPDGYLYGTARYEYDPSGNYVTTTSGVLFRLKPSDPNGTFEIIHRFASDSSEGHPTKGALLCVAASGVIYGVSTTSGIKYGGGASTFDPGVGRIFKYAPATGQFAVVASLDQSTVGSLTSSQSGLAEGPGGLLYGTTDGDGAGGDGTVYRFNPADNSVTVQYDFPADSEVGYRAIAGLTVGADGNLYGTTTLAFVGTNFYAGSVFRLRPDGNGNFSQAEALHLFAPNNGGTDYGEGLCQDAMIEVNHVLYGTCNKGGANNDGLVFQVSDSLAPTAPAPAIAPPVLYERHPDGTAKLTINGSNFAQGSSIYVSNIYTGTTLAANFVSAGQLTADLSRALPGGDHTVTVTNPDGQSGSATLTTPLAPAISATSYLVPSDGTCYVIVQGANFQPGCSVTVDPRYVDAAVSTKFDSATHLTVHLTDILPSGQHTVVVTNPDGQSGSANLYTLDPPKIRHAITVTDTDGSVHLCLDGTNFGDPGYNGSPTGVVFVVHDAAGNAIDTDVVGAVFHYGPLSQAILKLKSPPDGLCTVAVLNADGQFTDPAGAAAQTRAVEQVDAQAAARPNAAVSPRAVQPRDAVADAATAQIYTKDQTQYQFLWQFVQAINQKIIDIVLGIHTTSVTPPPSPTQIVVGNSPQIIASDSTGLLASGTGTGFTGLLSPGFVQLISQDGNGLIGQDGNGLISQDGNGIVGQGGGNIVGQGGGNLVNTNGSNIVGQGGGNAVPVSGGIAALASDAGGSGLLQISPSAIVGQGGGNFQPHASSLSPRDQAASSFSFFMTRHDEGPQNGTGSTDATVSADLSDGSKILLLDVRYTPGQPDVIIYQAPGISLKPTAGTPAPQVTNPTPTLTQISPNTTTAGSGDVTLSVTGTLFTAGAVVSAGGQPLATTVVSGTQLSAVLPKALLAAPGALPITVANPAPGGGASAPLPFTVAAAVPPITKATLAGRQNADGSYAGSVQITLAATPGTYPVAATVYALDGGAAQTYAGPITVTTVGAHTLTFHSTDGAGNAEANQLVDFTVGAAASVLHTFPAGLQMFSVPEDFSGVANNDALGTSGEKLAVWDPALLQYALSPAPPADALRLGQGYWARFPNDTPLYDLGHPIDPTRVFAIALKPGWNMVGDPFPTAIPFGDLSVLDGSKVYSLDGANRIGLVSRTLYAFPAGSTAYQALSAPGASLAPYQGCWVHAVRACTLLVSPTHVPR